MLISMLIGLLILAVCIYVVFLILGMLPIPDQIRTIVTLILALIFLIILLQKVGLMGGGPW